MYKFILVLFLNIIFYFVILSSSVSAQSCSGVPIGGSYTVSSSCSFANTVDGVDVGTGSTNTASITINSGVTLTISSGQTVAFGSLTPNGTIVITKTPSGGQLRKVPLWMTDADADNYPSSTTQSAQSTAPASGRRRNLMTSITSTDCNDANATVWQNLTGYGGADADADTYRAGAAESLCSGASLPSGYSSSQDCCDSDANAKPGQTSYFTTARTTCGGFDYNCNSTNDLQPVGWANKPLTSVYRTTTSCDVIPTWREPDTGTCGSTCQVVANSGYIGCCLSYAGASVYSTADSCTSADFGISSCTSVGGDIAACR